MCHGLSLSNISIPQTDGEGGRSGLETTTDLCALLSAWQDRYPDRSGFSEDNAKARSNEAQWLSPFGDAEDLTRSQVLALIDWRFGAAAHHKALVLRAVESDRWEHTSSCIREALRATSDVSALAAMSDHQAGVYGWGPSMSSVVLAACRSDRFILADARSLATLRALGRFTGHGGGFVNEDWVPFLDACRSLAEGCSESLDGCIKPCPAPTAKSRCPSASALAPVP